MTPGSAPLRSLRVWFVVHFVVDMLFGIPLLVAPHATLSFLGWTVVNPLTARLGGAALMGIGGQSLLGRQDSDGVFRAMLNLKISWSLCAVAGIGLTMTRGGPAMGWVVMCIFAASSALWIYYRLQLRQR